MDVPVRSCDIWSLQLSPLVRTLTEAPVKSDESLLGTLHSHLRVIPIDPAFISSYNIGCFKVIVQLHAN